MRGKYEFKKYINETFGEEYTIPLLGVWYSADEIVELRHNGMVNAAFFDGHVEQKKVHGLSQNTTEGQLFWRGF